MYLKSVLAATALFLGASQANAATYSFSQAYPGFGVFSGYFEAEDNVVVDSTIASFDGELTDFAGTFTDTDGSVLLSFDLSGIFGFVYELDGSDIVGDDIGEGLAIVDASSSLAFVIGTGPLSDTACDGINICGVAYDGSGDPVFGTSELFTVAQVPLPASGLLLGAGALGLGLMRRKKRAA